MNNRVVALILCLVIALTTAACQSANSTSPGSSDGQTTVLSEPQLTSVSGPTSPTDSETAGDDLTIIPFSERQYIYTNGLVIENKQVSSENKGLRIEQFYPQLSGFKNKAVQDKMNQEILDSMMLVMDQLAAAINLDAAAQVTLNTKVSNAAVVYNCNNVLFIEYFAYADATSEGNMFSQQKMTAYGYDLNTGNKLVLKDLFKASSNYEQRINDEVVMQIIENNYDDPESNFMTRPYQGLRENQNFSFDLKGLRMIMDDQNYEFINPGYPISFTIALRQIGDELAIFDRYFDSNNNLFEQKSEKELLPNPFEYQIKAMIEENGETYSICNEEGVFINLNDDNLHAILDPMTSTRQDVAGFRKRAKAYAMTNPGQYFGNIGHNIGLTMNEGGYVSILAYDVAYEKANINDMSQVFNYDLNRKQEMKLADLFIDRFDYRKAIGEILSDTSAYYFPDGSTIDESDIQTMPEDNFYFDKYGVDVLISRPGKTIIESYQWVPFEKLGWDNIALFN
jgi:hypothetical protein